MAAHTDVEATIGSIRLEGGDVDRRVVEILERVARGELIGDEAFRSSRSTIA